MLLTESRPDSELKYDIIPSLTMECVRDRLWIWGHEAGSHNSGWGLWGNSCMTPLEGARYLEVPNLIMITYGGKPEPPFDEYARTLSPLKQVIWSIVGDLSSTRNNESTDIEEVISVAGRHPNICGAIMDDFIDAAPGAQTYTCRYTPEDIAGFRQRLHKAPCNLDLWVVFYAHQLTFPVAEYLDKCDGVAFWTWEVKELSRLNEIFKRLEELLPGSRKLLGCYLWDYDKKRPMPLDRMEKQCETGLQLLRDQRVEGLIFLASCICDLNLDAVEWTRDWIAHVGDTPLRNGIG